MFIKDNIEQKNLQYKMFLLNDVFVNATRLSQRFTIQNVPIKSLSQQLSALHQCQYLQYKMFLLNLIFLKLPI